MKRAKARRDVTIFLATAEIPRRSTQQPPPPRTNQFRERDLSYRCIHFLFFFFSPPLDQLVFHLYINLFTFVIFDEFLRMYNVHTCHQKMLA